MNLLQLFCGLIGMGIVLVAVALFLKSRWLTQRLARGGDAHHTHTRPIPRLGGAALALGFVGVECFIGLVAPQERAATPGRWVVIASSLGIFGMGFWDDVSPLGARRKLLFQILIASLVWYSGIGIQVCKIPVCGHPIDLGVFGLLVTVLWLVAMTNLINLIDGVDGLAGGICLMLMLLIAYVGQQGGSFGLLSSGMAGALLGFLVFNFPPAKIFLGDSGAYFLGFQIGLFALINSHKGTVVGALLAPLFVLALPLVDTSLAILRRGLRGLPIFRPDRHHLHHHLMEMGLSRQRVVLSFYAVTIVFLAMGLLIVWSSGEMAPLLFGLAVVMLLALAGRLKFSRDWFSVGRVVGNSLAMRAHVQYTTCLMRWLELEGERAGSLEQLWQDLVFAGEKLGFASIQLKLEDGARVWHHPALAQDTQTHVCTVNTGRLGFLEVKGLKAVGTGQTTMPNEHGTAQPVAWDRKTFQLVGELFAEGWTKAAGRWVSEGPVRLRFDARLRRPRVARSNWVIRIATSSVTLLGRSLGL